MRWLLLTILLVGCAHSLTFSDEASGASRAGSERAVPARMLAWIDDDYGKAVAQARANKKPIFVETWAPW